MPCMMFGYFYATKLVHKRLAEKKADTRFKKEDVDNLVKLLLDGLSVSME